MELVMAVAMLLVPLKPADVKLNGLTVMIVPAKQSVTVDPLPVEHRRADGELKAGEPGWRGPLLLPGSAWTFRALRKGTLVVTPADQPDVKLVEGEDYLIDWDWGAVAVGPSGDFPAGTKVHFEYDYTSSRLDLVEQRPDGAIVVKKGEPDMGQPHLPEGTPGSTALLSVYLPPNTTSLTMDNINLMDPEATGVPPVSGTEHIGRTMAKLASGGPATIAFLGDSITAQQPRDFRDGRGSFVDRFTTYLRETHPGSNVVVTPRDTVVEPADGQIVVVKAGVGGDDTPRGLRRMDKDVIAHRPDAVVVMFGANDENGRHGRNNVPPPQYKKNLEQIVDRAQAAGAEVVLMTPSMKNLGWISTVGNMHEYAAVVREVARDKGTCLVDNFQAWEDVGKVGYNYMIYLGTCINHPVDLGHEVFFQGLTAAFED